jgi:hypothetical protein
MTWYCGCLVAPDHLLINPLSWCAARSGDGRPGYGPEEGIQKAGHEGMLSQTVVLVTMFKAVLLALLIWIAVWVLYIVSSRQKPCS